MYSDAVAMRWCANKETSHCGETIHSDQVLNLPEGSVVTRIEGFEVMKDWTEQKLPGETCYGHPSDLYLANDIIVTYKTVAGSVEQWPYAVESHTVTKSDLWSLWVVEDERGICDLDVVPNVGYETHEEQVEWEHWKQVEWELADNARYYKLAISDVSTYDVSNLTPCVLQHTFSAGTPVSLDWAPNNWQDTICPTPGLVSATPPFVGWYVNTLPPALPACQARESPGGECWNCHDSACCELFYFATSRHLNYPSELEVNGNFFFNCDWNGDACEQSQAQCRL